MWIGISSRRPWPWPITTRLGAHGCIFHLEQIISFRTSQRCRWLCPTPKSTRSLHYRRQLITWWMCWRSFLAKPCLVVLFLRHVIALSYYKRFEKPSKVVVSRLAALIISNLTRLYALFRLPISNLLVWLVTTYSKDLQPLLWYPDIVPSRKHTASCNHFATQAVLGWSLLCNNNSMVWHATCIVVCAAGLCNSQSSIMIH